MVGFNHTRLPRGPDGRFVDRWGGHWGRSPHLDRAAFLGEYIQVPPRDRGYFEERGRYGGHFSTPGRGDVLKVWLEVEYSNGRLCEVERKVLEGSTVERVEKDHFASMYPEMQV